MKEKSKTVLLPENPTVNKTGTECPHFSKQPILQKLDLPLHPEESRKAHGKQGNMWVTWTTTHLTEKHF